MERMIKLKYAIKFCIHSDKTALEILTSIEQT